MSHMVADDSVAFSLAGAGPVRDDDGDLSMQVIMRVVRA